MSGPTRQRSFRDRLHGIGLSWQGKRADSCKTPHTCSVSSGSSFDCHGYVNPLELVLDAKEGGSSSRGESKPCRIQPPDTGEYVVKAEDTLAGIAARFECTPGELTVLNKLTTRLIFPGQVLYVPIHGTPSGGAPTRVPTVSPGAEQYLKVSSRHITDGQGVVSGMLLVTPNKLMFIPNVSDPLVVEHGSEIYEVSAPMDLVVAAALYNDIAHMRVQHRQPTDKTPKAEVFRLPPLVNMPVVQQCAADLKNTQNLADQTKDLDQESVARPPQESTIPGLMLDDSHSQNLSPEVASATPSAVSHRIEISHSVPLHTEPAQTMTAEAKFPHAAIQCEVSSQAQSPLAEVPHANLLLSESSQAELLQSELPQAEPPCAATPESESPHAELGQPEPLPSDYSETELLYDESPRDKPLSAEVTPEETTPAEVEQVEATLAPSSLAAVPTQDETQLSQPLQSESPPEGASCGTPQDCSFHLTEGSSTAKQNCKTLLDDTAENTFCDKTTNATNNPILLSSSIKSDDKLEAMHLFNVDTKTKVSETNEDSIGPGTLEDGLPTISKSQAKQGTAGSPGGTLTYNMWLKNMVEEKPELFAALEKLVPRPAQASEAPLLYLCLRMGKPRGGLRDPRLHSQYWFGIPRPRVEELYRFLEKWAPSIYGDVEEADPSARGLELFDDESPEPPAVNPAGGSSSSGAPPSVAAPSSGARIIGGPLRFLRFFEGATEHPDWEVVPSEAPVADVVPVEEVPLPEMQEPSEILADEHRRQLCRHLPARAESYSWALLYSSLRDGFSLKTLYREMRTYEGPVLLVVLDTQGTMFGACASCPLKVSDHFYGTGESFLFTFHPRFRAYHWTGDNAYFIKGNPDSVAFGAGNGQFGLWLDGDLFHGRSRRCQTFCNQVLSQKEDFVVKAIEAWGFV
ncbi:oxidation resistance protein 1-like isoform X2 [Ornithodoros turicata]|uniref:oxidation resistance protein 1-like isoform X2 n=1 Tax=Ornithodoros turicata TaxID=34597 RepID=UPI003138A94D